MGQVGGGRRRELRVGRGTVALDAAGGGLPKLRILRRELARSRIALRGHADGLHRAVDDLEVLGRDLELVGGDLEQPLAGLDRRRARRRGRPCR